MRLIVPLLLIGATGCAGDPPSGTILSPADGSEFQLGEPVTFEAELADDRSPVGFLDPVWSSNIQGTLDGTRSFEGNITRLAVLDLAEGRHTITLRLTDPEENTAEDSIDITVLPNALPTITFTSPEQDSVFTIQEDTHVSVEVQFEDLNEDNIFDLALSWSGDVESASSLPDRPTGAGTASLVITDLEPGDYNISVSATDSYGGVGTGALRFSVIDADRDGDGSYDMAWGGTDCDDSDPEIGPNQPELCDGVDNDCDEQIDEDEARDAGTWYADRDGDGYGDAAAEPSSSCEQPADSADRGGDCDDSEPAASPGQAEVCDGIDNDCDEDIDEDDVCNLKLAGDSLATFYGRDNKDRSGLAVAHAGDVNGDGESDFLIGAPEYEDSYIWQGAAYLVFGPVSGDVELALADLAIAGESNAEYLGWSLDGGLDLNGDGYDDMLLGSPGHKELGSGGGAVTLLTGAPTAGAVGETAVLFGEAGERAGTSAVMARGLSGLPGAALVVGAPYSSAGSEYGGAVYVVDDLSGEGLLSEAPVAIYGETNDLAGFTVALQDLNGDGSPGLAVTALADQSDAGVVYLLDTLSTGAASVSDADAQLIGAGPGDWAGFSLAGGGDFNGDGYDDLVLGAPYESTAAGGAGAAYVVLGPLGRSISLASADLVLLGEAEDSYAGWSVGLADTDGDGDSEAFVGSPEALGSLAGSGVVYTVWGDPATAGTISLGDLEPRLEGGLSDESAGEAIDAADIDGDGRADLLIGASGNRVNGNNSGATYLLMGSAF